MLPFGPLWTRRSPPKPPACAQGRRSPSFLSIREAEVGSADARLVLGPFDPYAELAQFAAGRRNDGALASFVGIARKERDGGSISALVLEHYPGFTEKSLASIAADARERFPSTDVLVVHRAGRI